MTLLTFAATAMAAQNPVNLGRAAPFAILAGTTVTNTALLTVVQGDLGVSPGTAVTGFPPGIVLGNLHLGNPVAALAQFDLTAAYLEAEGRTLGAVLKAGNLGGQTLGPGLYKSTSSLEISSGDLTLDGGGDPNSVFIFLMASTLTLTPGRQVILTNKAHSANIFWQVGSSATFNTTTVFSGNVMCLASMTVGTGSTFNGRALALNGAVTLDGNTAIATPPYVMQVTSLLPNATYGIGQVVPVQVVFNEPVLVTGFPTLALNTFPAQNAVYADGDGSTTLRFTYTVAAPDASTDLDYASAGAFSLSGGSIVSDATGSAAELDLANPGTITSLGFNKNIVIATNPLYVELESFTAVAAAWNAPVQLTWITASEIDSVGFNVYRATPSGDRGMKLNSSIIESTGDQSSGVTYRWTDTQGIAPGESRTYLLENLDVSGKISSFGPIAPKINQLTSAVPDWTVY